MNRHRYRKWHYSDWNQLINDARTKGVRQARLSNAHFIKDLQDIQSVSHASLWRHRAVEDIHDMLDGTAHYDRSNPHDYVFIDDIHLLAKQVRRLRRKPGFSKLVRAGIFSDEGMYLQFKVTDWVSTKLTIVDLESKNPKFNSDIVAKLAGKKIHFQVKDAREETRNEKIHEAIDAIEMNLLDRSRAARTPKLLTVTKFTGTPPDGMPMSYLAQEAAKLSLKSQTLVVTIPARMFKNKTRTVLKARIRWRPYNDQRTAPWSWFFNNSAKLGQLYDKVVETYDATPVVSDDIYVMIAVTNNRFYDGDMRRWVAKGKVGILTLEVFGDHFIYRKLILPKRFRKEEKIFNASFPKHIHFVGLK